MGDFFLENGDFGKQVKKKRGPKPKGYRKVLVNIPPMAWTELKAMAEVRKKTASHLFREAVVDSIQRLRVAFDSIKKL
jgi:hypothetical protein